MRKCFYAVLLTIALLIVAVGQVATGVRGQQLETNMTIGFSIINGQNTIANYVGDYFTYNITLSNNSTQTITTSFTVEVFNVTHGLVSSRQYEVSLSPTHETNIYPNYTSEGRREYSIYFFEAAGTYELTVISGLPIAFYTYFPNGKYIVQHSAARFFFDALPASEKALNEETENWIKMNEAWILQSQQNTMTEQRLTRNIYNLTVLMFIATIVNAALVVWSSPKRTRLASVLFAAYLAIVFAVLVLFLLGIPLLSS